MRSFLGILNDAYPEQTLRVPNFFGAFLFFLSLFFIVRVVVLCLLVLLTNYLSSNKPNEQASRTNNAEKKNRILTRLSMPVVHYVEGV